MAFRTGHIPAHAHSTVLRSWGERQSRLTKTHAKDQVQDRGYRMRADMELRLAGIHSVEEVDCIHFRTTRQGCIVVVDVGVVECVTC